MQDHCDGVHQPPAAEQNQLFVGYLQLFRRLYLLRVPHYQVKMVLHFLPVNYVMLLDWCAHLKAFLEPFFDSFQAALFCDRLIDDIDDLHVIAQDPLLGDVFAADIKHLLHLCLGRLVLFQVV